MSDKRIAYIKDGLQWVRYEPSGNVTIEAYGMNIPITAEDWIKAVADLTANGRAVNEELFRAMHFGTVAPTIPPRRDFPTGQVNVDDVREALDHEREK